MDAPPPGNHRENGREDVWGYHGRTASPHSTPSHLPGFPSFAEGIFVKYPFYPNENPRVLRRISME